jgi:hypothetical protein
MGFDPGTHIVQTEHSNFALALSGPVIESGDPSVTHDASLNILLPLA